MKRTLMGLVVLGFSPPTNLATFISPNRCVAAVASFESAPLSACSGDHAWFDPDRWATKARNVRVDDLGLIVQADGDGGDTAQREGMYAFALALHGLSPVEFEKALDSVEIQPGVFVRHPYQPGFRSEPGRFSRDQHRPLVMAMGAFGFKHRLNRVLKAHVGRLGKYQNKDFIGPTNIGEYIRAYQLQMLYPLLLASDLTLIANSLMTVTLAALNPDEADDNNHIMTLLQAQHYMPTPLSWLARKIYVTFRPKNYGNWRKGESSSVMGSLAWYHRFENGGNPAIVELYRPLVSKM